MVSMFLSLQCSEGSKPRFGEHGVQSTDLKIPCSGQKASTHIVSKPPIFADFLKFYTKTCLRQRYPEASAFLARIQFDTRINSAEINTKRFLMRQQRMTISFHCLIFQELHIYCYQCLESSWSIMTHVLHEQLLFPSPHILRPLLYPSDSPNRI